MLKTIVGQFKDKQAARYALDKLHKRGFNEDSVVAAFESRSSKEELWQAGFFGAVGGAGIGIFIGLFAGISEMSVYTFNHLLATGVWNEFLGSILLGLAIGSILGGTLFLTIIWLGFRHQADQPFTENVQLDGRLVTVKAKDQHVAQVKRILEQAQAIDCQVT